ncbi:MAG TPA: hypothetical protein V6C72_01420, partial [Chroococcales cyanobacterium]
GTIEKITGRSLHPESVAVFASDPVEGRVLNHVDAPHGQDGKLTAVTLVVGSEPRISLSEVEMELGHHISVDKHPSVHEPANESPVVYKFNHHGLNIDGEFEDDQKNGHAEYLRAVTLF